MSTENDNKKNGNLPISGVMYRYCVALMYDKFGSDNKGRYLDYKIKQIIVDGENKNDAKEKAIIILKNEMKKYNLCVDSVLLIE